MILEEFRAIAQSNKNETADNAEPSAETSCTEASNAEAVGNCNADGDSNVNAEAKEYAEAESTAEGNKCSGGDNVQKQADAPPKDSGTPINQCGRKLVVLSEFCGCGDKVYQPRGENRNMGIYCGKNEVLSANARGSPAKASIYYLTRV